MTANKPEDREVILPIVLVEIDGIKTHALLDTGAGSSYASSKLINALGKKPKEVKTKRIEMMLGSSTTRVEIYAANLKSVDGKFGVDVELSKVEKSELVTVKNPEYAKLLEKYSHLKGAKFDDCDNRAEIPVHVVLGASDYATIKTTTAQKVGLPGQPVAEKTRLGWTVMSPGREVVDSPILLTKTASTDYEQLCALDVLGLADRNENDQQTVYQDFKEQLRRNEAGWYESKLPWKGNHAPLPTNEAGSKRRLDQLIRKLERTEQFADYEDIIQEQLQTGIVEAAPESPIGKEFYIPHKGVTRSEAESTKLRIVYDASAKERNGDPSLNDCLHPGPPLQNLLWSVLVRARSCPILLTGDLKKAFLQIRIMEEERDSLRFHWRHPNTSQTQVYRFTRALFGLTCSPFLLGGVINQHLDSWKDRYPELVQELREGLYVDDLTIGGTTVEEIEKKKATAVEVFESATFAIHKWHSNAPELEPTNEMPTGPEDLTYAKSQLGGPANPEGKLLGLPWNRQQDTLTVNLTKETGASTKRGVLSKLAKIYDPLGLASPTSLTSKLIYRDVCDAKVPWDADLPQPLRKRWEEWTASLETFAIPRSLAPHRQPISEITLHGFGDASSRGVCAAVYAVVKQAEVTQGIVCAKSRIAKRNLTIPPSRTDIRPYGSEPSGQRASSPRHSPRHGALLARLDRRALLDWRSRRLQAVRSQSGAENPTTQPDHVASRTIGRQPSRCGESGRKRREQRVMEERSTVVNRPIQVATRQETGTNSRNQIGSQSDQRNPRCHYSHGRRLRSTARQVPTIETAKDWSVGTSFRQQQ